MRDLLVALFAVLLSACSVATDVEPFTTDPPHRVWPIDDRLRDLATGAIDRLKYASGVRVDIGVSGTPLVWGRMKHELGFARNGVLAVNADSPKRARDNITLHEIMHDLGVPHGAPGSGIMAPALGDHGDERLTASDLELLCAVRVCDIFQPER